MKYNNNEEHLITNTWFAIVLDYTNFPTNVNRRVCPKNVFYRQKKVKV